MADQGIKDFVNALYTTQLGREADTAGLEAWSNAIASGMSQEAVANAIANSAEARVAQIYQQEVGRGLKGDAAAQNWVQAIESGNLTADQVRQQVARSQEGAQYDVARMYTGKDGLQRQGTYTEMAAKDPGIAQWEQALMSGQVTEQQFTNAVRQSQEYKALQAGTGKPGGTDTPKEDPNAKLIADLRQTLADNQKIIDSFKDTIANNQKIWDAEREGLLQSIRNVPTNISALTSGYQRQIQPLQQSLLSTNATENATRGFFSPAPTTYSPLVPTYSPGVTNGAQPGSAQPAPGYNYYGQPQAGSGSFVPNQPESNTQITPAPGYFVPQTYLAPPPPQYRSVDPFGPSFDGGTEAPFQSYYSIARRLRYPSQFGYGAVEQQPVTSPYSSYPSPYTYTQPTPTRTT